MASTTLTFGAILGTVNSAATTLTSTLSALGTGAAMLEAYAAKQQADQQYQYAQETVADHEIIDLNIASKLAGQVIEINKQKAKDPAFEQAFNHYFELLKANRK
jgi:hypothetical protein